MHVVHATETHTLEEGTTMKWLGMIPYVEPEREWIARREHGLRAYDRQRTPFVESLSAAMVRNLTNLGPRDILIKHPQDISRYDEGFFSG